MIGRSGSTQTLPLRLEYWEKPSLTLADWSGSTPQQESDVQAEGDDQTNIEETDHHQVPSLAHLLLLPSLLVTPDGGLEGVQPHDDLPLRQHLEHPGVSGQQ